MKQVIIGVFLDTCGLPTVYRQRAGGCFGDGRSMATTLPERPSEVHA
jgi:hypothetical protein